MKAMTDKEKWIADKIAKLMREGYSREQAVAIAYSMYKKGNLSRA